MKNKSKPKISVVMPFYNASKFLTEALDSVLNQTFSDFELILINDASTDDSDNIVKKYLSDSRIKYIRNTGNKGIVHNLNLGLAKARAEIIARMDGDDVCELDRFEKQFKYLAKHPEISMVGCNVRIINAAGKIIDQRTKPLDPEFIKKELIIYSPVVHPAVMFRKLVIQSLDGYSNKYKYLEDIQLWYKLVYSGYKISNVSKFLFNYRYHQSSTAHVSSMNAKNHFRLRQETIKKFNLEISLKQRLIIYLQLLVGMIFSGRTRQYLEGIYKLIFYHGK